MGNKLPNNWVETNIKTVSVISRGVSYQKNQASATSTKDAVYILRGGNIQDGQIDFDTDDNVYIHRDLVNEIQLVKKYDVVIVGSTGSKKLIGKAGIALNDFTDVSFGAFLMMLRTKVVDKKFHSYFFQTKYYRDTISQLAGGVAINNIRKEHLENLVFPLPPLAEQERIVAKLDALFAKIEDVKCRILNIKELTTTFYHSIFYNNFGLADLSQYLIEHKTKVGNKWIDYPKIGVSRNDGIIDLAVGTKETFENYKIVQPGDFIYNTMRVNIGSIAIYEGDVPAITSPDYVVFSVVNLSKYLLLNYLKSNEGATNISSVTKGSVRSRLYFKNLMTIPFPILTEKQHELAEKILGWFYKSSKKLNKSFDEALTKLSSSILEKAFKGELVEPLPTDGDAKDLLDKIFKLNKIKK